MIAPSVPENESERLAVMERAMCAFVPREERFDRITRTVRRLLNVPIALISIVESDAQWFRSAQGLAEVETPRNISFCGHAVASGKALAVPDATNDPRFWDNPLVTGSPYIRSYLGIPLSLAPGVRLGTLCALDNQVRNFTQQDILGMEDLAAMAEAELRLDAMGTTQRQLMNALGQAERRNSMDPATGCWNARGFRELLAMTVADCAREGTTAALCYVRVRNYAALTGNGDKAQTGIIRQLLAQVLRRRLPAEGALGSLGERDFCALVPGMSQMEIESSLGAFTYPHIRLDMPGIHMDLTLDLAFGLAFLDDMKSANPAMELWGAVLAGLKD
jgi:GGDEF domain-containing protein